jgi:hypothetical protein
MGRGDRCRFVHNCIGVSQGKKGVTLDVQHHAYDLNLICLAIYCERMGLNLFGDVFFCVNSTDQHIASIHRS